MRVVLNGDVRELPSTASVADIVAIVADITDGVAVAVNGDVVPRATWDTHHLTENDRVEVLSARQGG